MRYENVPNRINNKAKYGIIYRGRMKKRIRGLAIAILVGLMCLIAPINPCLAIANPDSLTIYTAKSIPEYI